MPLLFILLLQKDYDLCTHKLVFSYHSKCRHFTVLIRIY